MCIAGATHAWRFTGFYGNPNSTSSTFSWKLLSRLYNIHELQHLPWLVGGDFNEILYESEKLVGSLCSLTQMSAFRDVINSCMLCDLNFKGDPFTWCNRRQNNEIIDHRLISVSMKLGCEVLFRKGPKNILFEHKWIFREGFSIDYGSMATK